MIKITFSVVLGLMFLSLTGFSQDKKFEELQTDNEWSSGSIMTNDGKELKGLLKYDDRLGILHYVNGDESKSFVARNVTAFEFYDALTQKQRMFYSLEYEDSQRNINIPLFFEVLKDFKDFAVLSKIDPVKIEDKSYDNSTFNPSTGTYSPGPFASSGTEITQVETVYFLNQEGKIEPYIKVIRKVVDRTWYDREKKKNKFVDEDIIEKYFKKEEIKAMKEYAEKNDLKFQSKEDLIKILDFCEEFRAK